ncbi:hypothetical protein LWI29_023497 [Acer saccharum]|uniref:PORR domain-containing protein n=1 Tax=Acer saccharum TaxID=4024 RepID=A0AA39SJS2_ACESA|nr:hypothetical protein LWI29_023497 [Acer saccharum]
MDKYKNLLKVISVQDLILAPQQKITTTLLLSLSISSLDSRRSSISTPRPTHFLRKYPHIFHIFYYTIKSQPSCRLTDIAVQISRQEAEAINASLPVVIERLVRLLMMSTTKSLPLRAIFKVWRELGLPDDF